MKASSNYIKLWLRDALIAASTSFASASVLSAFFLKRGMNPAQVSFYMSFTQAVNLIVSLLFAGISEKLGNTKRVLSVLYAAGGVSTALFVIFCFFKPSAGVFYYSMLLIGSIIQVFAAVRFAFEYKIPCEVIEIEKYSTYVAFSNISGGSAGALAGVALSILYGNGSFMAVTAIAFIASGVSLLLAAAINSSLKILYPIKVDEKTPVDPISSFLRLIRNRDFRALAVPNFIRGFGAGVVAMITVLAIGALGLGDGDVPIITTLTFLGTLLSCFVYAVSAKMTGPAVTGLLGSIIFCVLPLSLVSTKALFFALYLIAYIGYNIVCCAIPDMVYRIAPSEIIGSFHTWRMALTTLGTVISTALIGVVSSVLPEIVVLCAGAAAILLCSAWYYAYYKKAFRAAGKNDVGNT